MSLSATQYRTQLRWAMALSTLSGASALAHQTLWTRRLVDILGASHGTFAKVVGVFFLGLSLGGWLAAQSRRDSSSTWRNVALAEFGIALLSLPIAFGANLGAWLAMQGWLNTWTQWILPFALILPPAIAMGFVTPKLLQCFSGEDAFRPAHALLLYSLNTLGGMLGIGAVVIWGVATLGLTSSALIAAGVNGIVACLAWRQARGIPSRRTATNPSVPAEGEARNVPLPWLISFLSGFLIMGQEVLLQHQFAQVTINSFFSSASVLAAVLLSLGSASLLLGPLLKRSKLSATQALPVITVLAAALSLIQPWLFLLVRPNLAILPYQLPPILYVAAVAGLCAVALIPLVTVSGLLFPLLLRDQVDPSKGDGGRRFGLLIAANGLGGWLGTEIAEGFLAPWLGLWSAMGMLGLVYLAIALASGTSNRSNPKDARCMLVKLGLACLLLAAWFPLRQIPMASHGKHEQLVESRAGREGVVSTITLAPDDWRILFNNSYTLGGSKAQMNQERQAHLPLLLHGNPKRVALLGVATGSTTAGATLHPAVESIDAIELSPLALEFAQRHFAPFNRHVFEHPKVQPIVEDARWVVASRPSTYDVIIGDLFLPWRTGEGRLFTQEHFEATHRALKPGGLFCQWLPLFQLTRKQFEVIVRTFTQVFPDALLLRGDFYTELPIVGLVGGRSLGTLDWAAIEKACSQLRLQNEVVDGLVRSPEGVAMCLIGPAEAAGETQLNTLQNAWLEWNAGKNIVGLTDPWFIGIPCAERLRDSHRKAQALLPARWKGAHDAGQFFLTLEIAAKLNLASLPALKGQIDERLPEVVRRDGKVDWLQWPSRIKPSPR